MRKVGVDFDLSLPQPTPEVDMEMVEDVDIEHEKSKSHNCPFWPSEEEFINSFNIWPMKIMRRPGIVPKKERLRQISPKKLAYLEKHIAELTQQGVLKELRNVESCHASPVHVVIESRYVASKSVNVEKS